LELTENSDPSVFADKTREAKHVNMIQRFFIDIFFVCESTEHLTQARLRQASFVGRVAPESDLQSATNPLKSNMARILKKSRLTAVMARNQRFLDENGGIYPAIPSDLTSLRPGRAHYERPDQKTINLWG
jgi:hypothetical protein